MNGNFSSTARLAASELPTCARLDLQTWSVATGALASVVLALGIAELRGRQAASEAVAVNAPSRPAAPSTPRRAPPSRHGEIESLRKIDGLLASAYGDMAALRLTHPPGQSAWDRFAAVLDFEPGNPQARRGLIQIAERYVALSSRASADGRHERARRYTCKAHAVQRASDWYDEIGIAARKAVDSTFNRCWTSSGKVGARVRQQ